MHQRNDNTGRSRTFLLLPSSSPSEELESSSALDGMVSKSSGSIEGKRRCVQPWGINRSHESLRENKSTTFSETGGFKRLYYTNKAALRFRHFNVSLCLSVWWLPGWEVDLGTVGLLPVVPLVFLSAGRASRKVSERKVPFRLMSTFCSEGQHSERNTHACKHHKPSTAKPHYQKLNKTINWTFGIFAPLKSPFPSLATI